jgi:Ca2+-binding EF-hand superfamily protein
VPIDAGGNITLITEATQQFMLLDEQHTHSISRSDFNRLIHSRSRVSLTRDMAEFIFDVCTLTSGGKLTMVEFMKGFKSGFIPVGEHNRSVDVANKIQELQRSFQILSGACGGFFTVCCCCCVVLISLQGC